MIRVRSFIPAMLLFPGTVLGAEIQPDDLEFFESKVRPLLVKYCYECHSNESGEASGELLLDSAPAVLKGGSHGPALVPGSPDNSLILSAIGYEDSELQMPPDGRMDDAAIGIIRRWIAIGAPDPREGAVQQETSPLDRNPASHWAFISPSSPRYPLPQSDTAADPIDAMAEAAAPRGLGSGRIAEREVLVRRLYYDLTGLPPSIDVIQSIVDSQRPDAYTRLVDRLLATPAFGERFARHWMDVSRYANTLGYATGDKNREHEGSERFRDWAIGAFANDMPYDEMIRHQLAGDRTDPNNEQGNLDAMGFLTLGRKFLNRFDTLDDRIDVISRGLLGLTVNCARCHDHKFDPISTADYYALAGILTSSARPEEPASPLMLADKENPADHPILIRGQPGNRGPPAPRQFLTALRKPNEPRFSDGSGRWELAQRVTDPENPLTARVMINRIWGHLIGRPLVETPSDFGFRTPPPAIPEILDDLAVEFAEHWSVKRIVRRIVLSRIYRQVATADADQIAIDADNRFLTRANRKRRDFESLRDSLLLVSGLLDRALGGVPVEITGDHPNPRRTIYAWIDRQNLPSVFRTFDFANPDTHSPQRYFTTVPQQSLYLMNDQQMMAIGRATARRVRDVGGNGAMQYATQAFHVVLGREPSPVERDAAVAFLAKPPAAVFNPAAAWSYGTATANPVDPISDFRPLSVFRDGRYQAADEFPAGAPYGHALLSRRGGHTASNRELAVVRRLTLPIDGKVKRIKGTFKHRSAKGDGIVFQVWIADDKVFEQTVQGDQRDFELNGISVSRGAVIDLVARPGASASFDSFDSSLQVEVGTADGRRLTFDSQEDFSEPRSSDTLQPLDRLAQLVHALMMTNEFVFVD